MIESVYWKSALLAQARAIKAHQRYKRWSEKQLVLLEREIMIAFFCIRSLIERKKITDNLTKKRIPVVAYPIRLGKGAHLLNRCDFEELYHMESPVERELHLEFLSNQIIHSYVIFAQRDRQKKKFSDLLVCSNYERNRQLFQVAIKELIAVMREVAKNYPTHAEYLYDERIRDYCVTATKA